ncbi:hypothetical protein FACS1894162_3130 [Bacteroidia bacterium]|nr:hypothetical protein FACS1894162_3130 [Bacteroidia bacterium]
MRLYVVYTFRILKSEIKNVILWQIKKRIAMTGSTAEIIKTALSKYYSYDADWEKAYFDMQSGGYNVYHKNHQFSKIEGGGDAEKTVGYLLAKYNGKQVEFLPEQGIGQPMPDLRFDGQTWDVKFIETI